MFGSRLRAFATGVYSFPESSFNGKAIMTAKLNLASNPFRNRAFPWSVTALIVVVSIFALLIIAQKTFKANAQAQAVEREVVELRKETDSLNRRAKEVETALTPDQKRELKYAHALVDRKRFSWARLFSDLENSLPGTVRVTRILVKEVRMDGDRPVADLDLIVSSKSPAAVTEMIQEMQSQGVFEAQLVTENPQRGRGETGSEYELNVHYVPRAGFAIEPTQTKPPTDTAGTGDKSR
jgi:Tfp pilus assembly protein PilN